MNSIGGEVLEGISKSIEIAEKNAKNHSVDLDTTCVDWTELADTYNEKFDCILCLGNSLACEVDLAKRKKAVLNWSTLLSDDGVIVVDRRNYEALLNSEYNYAAKGQYFGSTVKVTIVERMSFSHRYFYRITIHRC